MENNDKKTFKKVLLYTLVPLAIILSFVGGYFSRYLFLSPKVTTSSDIITIIDRLGYVYDARTGEEVELTEEDIADLLVDGILDRYSAYYSKDEYGEVTQNADGKYTGVGISLSYTGEIVSITLSSPAELAGLKKGDIAVSVTVDGQTTPYTQNDGADFTESLLGAPVGKTVILTVKRGQEQLDFEIVKRAYTASYIVYHDSEKTLNFRENEKGVLSANAFDGGMNGLDDKTAYIQLTAFNGGAGEQMKDALDYMKERGKTKLILDLRDNGGGYLNVLEDIASYFIYNGGNSRNLIAYAEGKQKSESFYSGRNKFYDNLSQITVLANENTASASECLIGAMLHYKDVFDQSKLIIEKNAEGVARTYGKGIMQTTYGLVNGGALKLTTAKIYLPDKTTSIHAVGFRADEINAVEKGEAVARAIELLAE